MIFLKNHHKENLPLYIFMAVVAILVILAFTGCYSQKKAKEQFNKAALNYPEIGSNYCANEFPVKDSVITDTVSTTDTLYVEGLSDTVMIQDFDTVRITITKTLPAKIITNTVHIRDTIIRENTAALKSCEIDKSKTIDLLVKKTGEADKYKGQARKRGFIMWGLILLLIAIVGLNIYLRTKKVIK